MALFAVEYTYSDATVAARDEHRPTHRSWLSDLVDAGKVVATGPWVDGSGALILIDVADEAAAHELMAQDPFAQRMNSSRKYVVSNTLKKAAWNNTAIIKGSDLVAEITRLRQQPGGPISVVGSGTLVQSLLQHDLLDELQLLVAPVLLGVGSRLFKEGAETKTLTPVDAKRFNSGMLLLTFVPASQA